MSFTAEELEAMRKADEEIEREFSNPYLAAQFTKAIDKELDRIATYQCLDSRQAHKRKYHVAYQAKYRETHGEIIAKRRAAYNAAHREEECKRVHAWYMKNREKKMAQVAEWKRKKRAAATTGIVTTA